MRHVFRVCLIVLVVFLGVVGFINAKPNPASLIFNQQTANQNNMQIVNLNSQLSSIAPSNFGGNPQTMAVSGIPEIVVSATGNFNPGGIVVINVVGSPNMAYHPYLLAFSLYGDYPGTTFPGIGLIPLNQPILTSFFGFLGPNGNAQFMIQLPNTPSLIGLPLTAAALVLNPQSNQIDISNPVSFEVGRGLKGISCCTQGVLNGPGSQCTPRGVSANYCRYVTSGAVQECIPNDIGVDPAPSNRVALNQSTVSANSSFMANLTRSINLSNITTRAYNATTYDCDDFADDLEQWLQTQGYNATFTQFVKYAGVNSSVIDYVHAVIDVHLPDGSIIWIEPQTGKVIDLDFDGDGNVGANVNQPYRNGHHPTDDNAKIYVYESAATAAANGAPRD